MKNFSTNSFVFGVMLGVLLSSAWFLVGGSYVVQEQNSLNSIATSTDTIIKYNQEKSGSISIVNQSSGDSVIVESITVPPPGVWVAVREINGSDLGNVLGAARVSGPKSSVVVPLLRMTEPNRSYAIELYRDDADGIFDPKRNSVYIDFNTGSPVVSYFITID